MFDGYLTLAFVGYLAVMLFVARRLRVASQAYGNAIMIPDFISNRFDDRTGIARISAALIILVSPEVWWGASPKFKTFSSRSSLPIADALV